MGGSWGNEDVFPKWREKYPTPPDLIGVTRVYLTDVDKPVLKANQAMVKSIPMDFKQSLKEYMKPVGFTGFKVDELTPNRTRRAQCTNFLLYYKQDLRGYTLEELRARKKEKMTQQAAQLARPEHVAHT